MRKTLLCLLLTVSTAASAQALGSFLRGWRDAAHEDTRATATDSRQWDRATFTGQEPTADYRLQKCRYQTISGMEFAIMQRNQCPMTVFLNPETGEVRK